MVNQEPTLGKFCDACQAIPSAGYCKFAGCPNVPAPAQTAAQNLENCQRQLDWDGVEVGVSRQALDEVLAELKVCHEVIGGFVVAQAYADSFPDDAADAKDLKFCQHYWEGAASSWAGEDLLSRSHEAAKARMSVENPVQVHDLGWPDAPPPTNHRKTNDDRR